MKKNIGILITVLTVAMLSGCGQKEQAETKEIISGTEAITEVVTEVIEEDATLDEVEALLGMQDLETADLLGGGKENWSEDKSLYIGRVYEVSLYGTKYPVYTSCDKSGTVDSVSVWLADNGREVSETEVEQWVQRLSEYTNIEPRCYEISSEPKSQEWKWISEDRIVSLRWSEQILNIGIQPATGELN